MRAKTIPSLILMLLAAGWFRTAAPVHAAVDPVVSKVSFVQEAVVNPGPRRVTVTYTLAHLDSAPALSSSRPIGMDRVPMNGCRRKGTSQRNVPIWGSQHVWRGIVSGVGASLRTFVRQCRYP